MANQNSFKVFILCVFSLFSCNFVSAMFDGKDGQAVENYSLKTQNEYAKNLEKDKAAKFINQELDTKNINNNIDSKEADNDLETKNNKMSEAVIDFFVGTNHFGPIFLSSDFVRCLAVLFFLKKIGVFE
jgi:hypothetical protein